MEMMARNAPTPANIGINRALSVVGERSSTWMLFDDDVDDDDDDNVVVVVCVEAREVDDKGVIVVDCDDLDDCVVPSWTPLVDVELDKVAEDGLGVEAMVVVVTTVVGILVVVWGMVGVDNDVDAFVVVDFVVVVVVANIVVVVVVGARRTTSENSTKLHLTSEPGWNTTASESLLRADHWTIVDCMRELFTILLKSGCFGLDNGRISATTRTKWPGWQIWFDESSDHCNSITTSIVSPKSKRNINGANVDVLPFFPHLKQRKNFLEKIEKKKKVFILFLLFTNKFR